jgi:hypothetical protein
MSAHPRRDVVGLYIAPDGTCCVCVYDAPTLTRCVTRTARRRQLRRRLNSASLSTQRGPRIDRASLRATDAGRNTSSAVCSGPTDTEP